MSFFFFFESKFQMSLLLCCNEIFENKLLCVSFNVIKCMIKNMKHECLTPFQDYILSPNSLFSLFLLWFYTLLRVRLDTTYFTEN